MIYYRAGSDGMPYEGYGIIEGDSPIDVGHVTTITLSGLSETEDYYFAATAYNHEGVESGYSNEVSVIAASLNQPPKADAAPEQSVEEGSFVSLSGRNSTDSDGRIVSFQWQQTGGPGVLPEDPGSAETNFAAPEVGTDGAALSFQLSVTDDDGLTSPDDFLVNISWINEPPLADAGTDQTGSHDEEVQLDASPSSDSDDGIASYSWRQKAGTPVTLDEPVAMKSTFVAPETEEDGEDLAFELTVTDHGCLQSAGNNQVAVLPVVQSSSPKNLWVSYIECEVQKSGRRKYVATAQVTVIDEDFQFVEGATVTGNWTLGRLALNTSSNQTDLKGTAKVVSKQAWARSGRVFTFTVTGVSKEGYSYDPTSNIRTKDSIAVP